MDASGVKLQTQSLATILMGGVAFETPAAAAKLADEGSHFNLATDRMEALKAPDGEPQTLVFPSEHPRLVHRRADGFPRRREWTSTPSAWARPTEPSRRTPPSANA